MATTHTVNLVGGQQMTLSDVVDETFEDVLVYDGDTYRDTIDAAFSGISASVKLAAAQTAASYAPADAGNELSQLNTAGATSQAFSFSSPIFIPLAGAETLSAVTFLQQADEYTHTAPRYRRKTRTRVIWWKSAAMQQSANTTNGSRTVVLASTTGLSVGAAISGSGIPSGSKIVSITNATDVVISLAATATATVTVTIANSGMAGWAWQDEITGLTNGAISYIQ